MTLTAIEPDNYPWFPYRGFTFCLGLEEGGAAWTSGQSAGVFDPEVGKSVVRGTMREQATLAYTKLLDVFEHAGLGRDDVVSVVENVTAAGMPQYAEAAAARAEIFAGRQLAVTTVAVDRLVRGAALIEIELSAIPGGGEAFGAVGGWTNAVVREGLNGAVTVPTLLPIDSDGTIVSPGDAAAQFGFLLDRAEDALEAAGLTADSVVSAQQYVAASAQDALESIASIRRERWGATAAGGTVLMASLHAEGILVALDVTASRVEKTVIDPGWARFSGESMAPAVQSAGVLYLSALASLDRQSGVLLHADDLAAQAQEVYEQLTELVAFGGGEPASIRSTIEFCVADRIGQYRTVAPVREQLLSAPWPASTGDLCTAFVVGGSLIQTTAIAHVVS